MTFTRAQLAAIKALENGDGQIAPRQIVQAAKNRRSPLHALFDWNVTNAAEKWWLHQARVILGAVTIQVTTQEFTYKAPAYVVDTTVDGQGYRSLVALKDDHTNARETLVYTLETAAGHLRRALDLAAPLGLSGEVDQLLQEVASVQRVAAGKAA
jgi:hypothetical protein